MCDKTTQSSFFKVSQSTLPSSFIETNFYKTIKILDFSFKLSSQKSKIIMKCCKFFLFVFLTCTYVSIMCLQYYYFCSASKFR